MSVVVSVDNVGKSYVLRHELRQQHDTLRDAVTMRARTIRGAVFGTKEKVPNEKITREQFWALKEICFDVKAGDRLGIVGRNGSGKSTLLKVLSRITAPTTGRIEIRGRVASLLEVGTGFHAELTGRENIFLNGAILGMSKGEIRKKFDEIVAFAETERFLDTPVKRYSSGMYVRLAFSVAAHLDPEILIVDEVLAVGDAAFQKKCLGRMQEGNRNGQTVIFVSHQMAAIQKLCNRCLLLNGGTLQQEGPTQEVLQTYLELDKQLVGSALVDRGDRRGTQRLKFASIDLSCGEIANGTLLVRLMIINPDIAQIEDLKVSVDVNDVYGNHISNLTNYVVNNPIRISRLQTEVELTIRDINLVQGNYVMNVFMATDRHNSEILDWVEDAARFEVPERDYYGTGVLPPVRSGIVLMSYEYDSR